MSDTLYSADTVGEHPCMAWVVWANTTVVCTLCEWRTYYAAGEHHSYMAGEHHSYMAGEHLV